MDIGNIPEKLDMDFLLEHENDEGMSEYLLENYEKHIDDFDEDDLPEACLIMGFMLMRATEAMEDIDLFTKYNEAALDICQIGLGVASDIMTDDDEDVILMCYDIVYRLYNESALILMNLERNEEAEEALDNALSRIEFWTKYFDEKDAEYSEEIMDELFSDELTCRSYKAEVWWRMSRVAEDTDERADLLMAAKKGLEYTVDTFKKLECEWEEKYFGEILDIVNKDLGIPETEEGNEQNGS